MSKCFYVCHFVKWDYLLVAIYICIYIYIYIYINRCSMEQISSLDCWERNFIISFFPFNFPMLSLYLILNFHYYVSFYLHLVCQLHLSMSIHFHQSIIKYFLLQLFIRIDPLIHEYTLSPFYDKIFFPLAFYKY